MSRNRLPARRAIPCIVERNLDELATPPRDGTWVEAAIAYHAAATGDMAKCIADIGVFAVSETLVEHGLVEDRLDFHAVNALHPVITEIVVRLIRERLIERFSEFQENPDVLKNVTRRGLITMLLTDSDR